MSKYIDVDVFIKSFREALCELSYLVGGIPGMNAVMHFGLEEGADND